MTEKINIKDPLLDFFHELFDSDEEKEIISMIFKGYSEEKIIETLIEYSADNNKKSGNAKI
jgi:hypothetical protein